MLLADRTATWDSETAVRLSTARSVSTVASPWCADYGMASIGKTGAGLQLRWVVAGSMTNFRLAIEIDLDFDLAELLITEGSRRIVR